jgi:pimeloyl-ACP methyl ester carboxylesterase
MIIAKRGSTRAALLGVSEGGPLSALFAATYPMRTSALIMYGAYAKWTRDADLLGHEPRGPRSGLQGV